MLIRQWSVLEFLRNEAIEQIKPAIGRFIQYLSCGNVERQFVGRVEKIMRHVNLVGQGVVDQVGHADSFPFPFVVELQHVRQPGVPCFGVGENTADWNGMIQLFQHQLVRQMAGVADG